MIDFNIYIYIYISGKKTYVCMTLNKLSESSVETELFK